MPNDEDELDDLDLRHNPHPVCPYCGARYYDAWELSEYRTEHEIECGSCERSYVAEREVEVRWNTRR